MVDIQEVLGLDVGSVRIGVARVNMTAKIPEALSHIEATNSTDSIKSIIAKHHSDAVVVGLPRDMKANETNQTAIIRDWVFKAKNDISGIPFYWQDEAVTSLAAEELLGPDAKKGDIDSLAAAILLKDFINTPPEKRVQC